MQAGKLKQIGTHPAFISLIILAGLVLVLPLNFPKYIIKHINNIYTPKNIYCFYDDLDSDGFSEEMSFDIIDTKQTKIIVSRNNRVLKQFDLRYQPYFNDPLFINDYNSDGYREIYVFTISEDSIFLNIIDPVKSSATIISGRFVDFRRSVPNSNDTPNIVPVGMIENKNGHSKDLIFTINTGYSLQPRNVYRYIIEKDSLIKSPASGAPIIGSIIADIDDDLAPEILLSTVATGNLDPKYPYTDNFSWLMILDENLRFKFPPLQFGPNPSRVQTIPVTIGRKKRFLAFFDFFGTDTISPGFYLFDHNGSEIMKARVPQYETRFAQVFPTGNNHNASFYFLKDSFGHILEMDSSLNVMNVIKIPGIAGGGYFSEFDADFDGKPEYFLPGENRSSSVILKDDFRDPVVWQHSQYDSHPLLTHFFKTGQKPMLYAQFPGIGIFFRYEKNPFYFLKYPAYPALYGLIYLLIIVIARGQRYRLNILREQEKELVQLQIKAIRNQLDPHFTLNVLNAIGSLYSEEGNKEKADYIFGKYAKMIRQTVISSDRVIVTLEEELDFVRNYIEIENFRYNNSFIYSIDIKEGSDIKSRIPRMLIHTFVENAIKYGIRNRSDGGVLKITLQKTKGIQSIIVENNGPFLANNDPLLNGTGKGMLILNDLIELFHKIEKIRITYDVRNVDEGSDNQVTRATINVPCSV